MADDIAHNAIEIVLSKSLQRCSELPFFKTLGVTADSRFAELKQKFENAFVEKVKIGEKLRTQIQEVKRADEQLHRYEAKAKLQTKLDRKTHSDPSDREQIKKEQIRQKLVSPEAGGAALAEKHLEEAKIKFEDERNNLQKVRDKIANAKQERGQVIEKLKDAPEAQAEAEKLARRIEDLEQAARRLETRISERRDVLLAAGERVKQAQKALNIASEVANEDAVREGWQRRLYRLYHTCNFAKIKMNAEGLVKADMDEVIGDLELMERTYDVFGEKSTKLDEDEDARVVLRWYVDAIKKTKQSLHNKSLGLGFSADQLFEQIGPIATSLFRELSRTLHPDKLGHAPSEQEVKQFQQIQEAYDVLGNPTELRRYVQSSSHSAYVKDRQALLSNDNDIKQFGKGLDVPRLTGHPPQCTAPKVWVFDVTPGGSARIQVDWSAYRFHDIVKHYTLEMKRGIHASTECFFVAFHGLARAFKTADHEKPGDYVCIYAHPGWMDDLLWGSMT
mmetsp:Transcript_2794/g.4242  ORF Transcript_2794/g.4242 Transcript_2794/m.4242 type:complete len:505 (+) Transcript_2794:35-1549(+)